eukprot:245780_1
MNHVILDEEEMYDESESESILDNESDNTPEYYGHGNAKKGYREAYDLYDSSDVVKRLLRKKAVWHSYILFGESEFIKLCDDIYDKWSEPRTGDCPRGRKHPVQACLFAVLGIMRTGMTTLNMEGLAGMPSSLINVEFKRILQILDEVLASELTLLSDEEKKQCYGSAPSNRNIIYYLDGCDFPVRISRHKWLYKTHKSNVKKNTAIRAQILIDSFWGYFRGVEVDCAGITNDQGMLNESWWNSMPGILTPDASDRVACDEGYLPTQYVNVVKPYSRATLHEYQD